MKDICTQWNGQDCSALRVTCTVADAPQFPQYWARELIGQHRKAVLVFYSGRVFLLDDEEGEGWYKVTHGGSPLLGSKDLEGTNIQPREE